MFGLGESICQAFLCNVTPFYLGTLAMIVAIFIIAMKYPKCNWRILSYIGEYLFTHTRQDAIIYHEFIINYIN